ncbi:flagellar export chaperone FlgN [Scatolibacter rhodanostii]|uniref:flagellar export chaperone FlgN n=1 Tax=Scatolibacter rhodanostii TaxID=2014781 RepID=UPI000C074702|nr:flagellar export chaperone FlgN [Scatolibacter rhodanostii]
MNDSMSAFYDITQKALIQIQSMLASEQEKRSALLNHNTEKIESLLQEQQAMMMKLEGLEKKRLASQADAGFLSLTSTQILEKMDKEERKLFAPLFTEMRHAATQLQELNFISLDLAHAELRFMERLSASEENHALYQSDGKKRTASHVGASFEEKI